MVNPGMLFQRQDSEIAPRPSMGSGRSEPAELRRRLSACPHRQAEGAE